MTDKLAASAARKIEPHLDPYFRVGRDSQETIAAIIATEYEPAMDSLRHVLMCSGTPSDCEDCAEAERLSRQ